MTCQADLPSFPPPFGQDDEILLQWGRLKKLPTTDRNHFVGFSSKALAVVVIKSGAQILQDPFERSLEAANPLCFTAKVVWNDLPERLLEAFNSRRSKMNCPGVSFEELAPPSSTKRLSWMGSGKSLPSSTAFHQWRPRAFAPGRLLPPWLG